MILVLNEWVKFFPKIFLEIFYEYFTCGIEPPFHPSKCHIWGGYGRGEGVYYTITPHANSEGREWFVNNFNWQLNDPLFDHLIFFHYLCIVTFINEGDRVDSILPYSLETYKHKKIPHLLEED